MLLRRLAPLLLLTCLVTPGSAAAAPAGDDRDDAQPITQLPASTSGDLRGAGLEAREPGSACPVRFELQQLDPFSGWQYVRTVPGEAVAGVATVTFAAPTVGRWRARATYLGTRGRAPSVTGFAAFAVDRPLRG